MLDAFNEQHSIELNTLEIPITDVIGDRAEVLSVLATVSPEHLIETDTLVEVIDGTEVNEIIELTGSGAAGPAGPAGPRGLRGPKGDPGLDADPEVTAQIAAEKVLSTEFQFGEKTATLATVAENALVPTLSFIGEFSDVPTQSSLGNLWKQNSIYKNAKNGTTYVLTGNPLHWLEFVKNGSDGLGTGTGYTLLVQSSKGTVYKPGDKALTMLSARLFFNGEEVTEATPMFWFQWRRVSVTPLPPPNDDATWNKLYEYGFRQVSVPLAYRASYFCDIVIR